MRFRDLVLIFLCLFLLYYGFILLIEFLINILIYLVQHGLGSEETLKIILALTSALLSTILILSEERKSGDELK